MWAVRLSPLWSAGFLLLSFSHILFLTLCWLGCVCVCVPVCVHVRAARCVFSEGCVCVSAVRRVCVRRADIPMEEFSNPYWGQYFFSQGRQRKNDVTETTPGTMRHVTCSHCHTGQELVSWGAAGVDLPIDSWWSDWQRPPNNNHWFADAQRALHRLKCLFMLSLWLHRYGFHPLTVHQWVLKNECMIMLHYVFFVFFYNSQSNRLLNRFMSWASLNS